MNDVAVLPAGDGSMPEAALLTPLANVSQRDRPLEELLANVSQRDRPLEELLAMAYADVPDVFALSRWA